LNAVIGYSEMLLEDAEIDGDKEQIADLRRINSAGKHLLSLVTDVLDLSKIEAEKTELVAQSFDLVGFIDDVGATCRPLVINNGNDFIVERDDALGNVLGDATKLRQATLNLLSNAGKFTKNGRVVMSVKREQGDSRDWISIAVRDTGIGISPTNLRKLFQDFNQAEASTASRYGGTGLGLALSRNLCRMMGGEITVESEVGQGSCFTMRFPASLDIAAGRGAAPAHADYAPVAIAV
jgi:signal transduction histidine kinase